MDLTNTYANDYPKSDFQNNFKINSEFYDAKYIREAIRTFFPNKKGLYQGLSRIIFNDKILYPWVNGNDLDLEKLIPNITPETIIPNPLPRIFAYSIYEGFLFYSDASTHFIPTEFGYICDEMHIKNFLFNIDPAEIKKSL